MCVTYLAVEMFHYKNVFWRHERKSQEITSVSMIHHLNHECLNKKALGFSLGTLNICTKFYGILSSCSSGHSVLTLQIHWEMQPFLYWLLTYCPLGDICLLHIGLANFCPPSHWILCSSYEIIYNHQKSQDGSNPNLDLILICSLPTNSQTKLPAAHMTGDSLFFRNIPLNIILCFAVIDLVSIWYYYLLWSVRRAGLFLYVTIQPSAPWFSPP